MISQEAIDQHVRMTGHALFAPSSMSRIISCPASIQETLEIPPPESSDYAKHGTKLHDVVAEETIRNPNIGDALRAVNNRLDIEDRDKELIGGGLDFFENLLNNYQLPKVFTEVKVSLDFWGVPEVFGTADKIVLSMLLKRILVLDWKFGAGVAVKVENNAQLQTYGAGALAFLLTDVGLEASALKDWVVELAVAQPALDAYDTWDITAPKLLDWVETEMKPALVLAKSELPPYQPTPSNCKFCNAGKVCRHRHDMQKAHAREVFTIHERLVRGKKPPVTREEISKVLRSIADMEQYFKDIRTYAYAEIASARPIPDWKLVSGRSVRKWEDEDRAMSWLLQYGGLKEEQLYTKKAKGPAAIEKLHRQFKKDPDFAQLVTKPPGKPQLVPENDPREAITLNDPKTAFAEAAQEYEE